MTDRDLTSFLNGWPHEPGRIGVRKITGSDGREKIQVRIELGVLQMELDGRPDGARPEGRESLLDFQLDRLERYRAQPAASAGFALSTDECKAMREEAVQYYHRYVALFAMGDFARVIRDATRNLRVIDLCHDFAASDADRTMLDQFRPTVIAARVRAEAEFALQHKQPKEALTFLDRGLTELESFFQEHGQGELFQQSNEAQLLRGMRDALVPKLPASQRAELEQRLREAIALENFELAAILRDELRLLE